MGKVEILGLEKKYFGEYKELLKKIKVFNKEEIKVATEIAKEYLKKGKRSGYDFLLAKENGSVVGFICFGPTPLTKSTYDLYWIAVKSNFQGKSIGKKLLEKCEEKIIKYKGKIIIAETSSTKKYEKARKFYESQGFKKIAEIKNFYKFKDNKLIYVKYLKGGN